MASKKNIIVYLFIYASVKHILFVRKPGTVTLYRNKNNNNNNNIYKYEQQVFYYEHFEHFLLL